MAELLRLAIQLRPEIVFFASGAPAFDRSSRAARLASASRIAGAHDVPAAASAPRLRALTLFCPPDFGSQSLRRLGALTRLTRLELFPDEIRQYNWKIDDWDPLTTLTDLESLVLRNTTTVNHLAAMKKLRHLDIRFSALGRDMRTLAGLTALESLDIQCTHIASDAEAVLHLSALSKLTHLNLTANRLDAKHLRTLMGLRSLDARCNMSSNDMRHIAALTRLTHLDVTGIFTAEA